MKPYTPPPEANKGELPTRVRYRIVGAATLAAVFLYLDRICIAEIVKTDDFRSALSLNEKQTGAILSAFFFSYALGQVPAGWLSDRFGARKMLPLYIAVWSVATLLTGLVTSFTMLIVARLAFGMAQAGCYPSAGGLIRRWIPLPHRGTASSIVSFGGRLGGAIAPLLTAWLLKDWLSWQGVLALYGCAGFVIATAFYVICRESPALHPACNAAERALVAETTSNFNSDASEAASAVAAHDGTSQATQPVELPPILALISSPTMWLMCLLQYGINVGWVFLVTWLPTYLKEIKHVDPKVGGLMSSIVLLAGVVGMLCGGPLTDRAVTHLGRRWGRSLPMVVCYTIAIVAYLSCLRLESAWAFIAAAATVAFVTDMSVPGIWAYMQDVGGKNTAAVFGWGNMWGNFGAATTPLLVPIVLNKWDSNGDWHEAFWLFSLGYLMAAVAALGINANRTVKP